MGPAVWSYLPVMSIIARTVVDRQRFVIQTEEEEIVKGSQVVYVCFDDRMIVESRSNQIKEMKNDRECTRIGSSDSM